MNRYIGTKLINAKPMTRLAYNILRGRKLPDDENGEDEGYLTHDTECGEYSGVEGFDGYIQWMPQTAFNFSYRQIDNMTFGLAIEALKQGKKVARAGWNGKGMWLSYVGARAHDVGISALGVDASNLDTAPQLLPWIGMKTADNKFVPWLASQTDVLSGDWQIVE